MTKIESKQKLAIDILKNEFDELIEKKEIKVKFDAESYTFMFLIIISLVLNCIIFFLHPTFIIKLMLIIFEGLPALLVFSILFDVYFISVNNFKKMIHKSFIVNDYDQNILDLYRENKNADYFDGYNGFSHNDYYKKIKYKNISKSSLDIIDKSDLRKSIIENFKYKIENGEDLTVDNVLEFLLD